MPDPFFIFLCSSCGWKKVCGMDDSGLREVSNDTISSRKFRCPSCGRAISPKKFPNPQSEMDKTAAEKSMKLELEAWMAESAEFQSKFIEAKDGKDIG
jgi:transposase